MSLAWLGSAAGGLIGGALSNSASRHAMNAQIAANRYDYQHRYQWAMQDMQQAGLNPILAATQGIAGTVNGASALGASYNSIGGDLAAGAGADASSSSAKAQQKQADTAARIGDGTVEKLHSDVALNGASARKLDADTQGTIIANKLASDSYSTNLALVRQNLANAEKQGALIDQNTANAIYQRDVVMPAQANMMISQGNAANSAASYNNQQTSLSFENTRHAQMQNEMRGKYGTDTSDGLVGSVTGATTHFLDLLKKRYFGW